MLHFLKRNIWVTYYLIFYFLDIFKKSSKGRILLAILLII